MTYNELENLLTFKIGLPSLYHIMLGMSEDETECYQSDLETQQTDNYDLNDFLKKYSVIVDRNAFTDDWRLKDISVSIPIEYMTEKVIQGLFVSLVARMNVTEKRFSITTDTTDTIKDLDITIHTDLYDVEITKGKGTDDDTEYVVISFICEDEMNLDKLRCLAIIANQKSGFADEVFEYAKRNRL